MHIPVLYEDASVIVCIKPSGLLSENTEGSLPARLLSERGLKNIYCVHRLDRETSGVMVYAKTKSAAAALSAAFAAHTTEKRYAAVVAGVPTPADGSFSDLIYHDRTKNRSYVVTRKRAGVREALLTYHLVETVRLSRSDFPAENEEAVRRPPASAETAGRHSGAAKPALSSGTPLSLLSVTLLTGRSHQIRAQFASRGLPLVGDRHYGSKEKGPLALFCEQLAFPHPVTNEVLVFSAPLPDAFPWTAFQG